MKHTPRHAGDLINSAAWIGFHVVVVALSAATALSLPAIARAFLGYWSRMEEDGIFLISAEIVVAIALIALFNYLRVSSRDRRLARVALGAGLVAFSPSRSPRAHGRIKALKEKHGVGRGVMVIGSTGYETFVDEESDFRVALQKCLWANILLLNPYSEEARKRVEGVSHPDFTLGRFREEVTRTIELLRRLKATGKDVRLKFYSDPPLIKLVIAGDFVCLQHYHTSVEVRTMPEYIFQHNSMDHGLYTLFYQYFVKRWGNPAMPEYDFDADEVVYKGSNGSEARRVPFGPDADLEGAPAEQLDLDPDPISAIGGGSFRTCGDGSVFSGKDSGMAG